MNLLLLGVLLAIVAIAYQIGLAKSRNLAGKGQNSAMLHSRPGYYGALVALWCGIPAFLILIVWNLVEPNILRYLILSHLPTEVTANLDAASTNVVMERIRAIASGFGVTDTATPYEIAAAEQLSQIQTIGTFAKVAVEIGRAHV